MAMSHGEAASSGSLTAEPSWPRISDFAIIGDCRTAALVASNGAVEWLCWPRFDSPSVFAAILDRDRGGTWKISPRPDQNVRTHRKYIAESNVLQTTFECRNGIVTITDLMPIGSERGKRTILGPDHELLRRAECIGGEVEMELIFQPRPR